MKTDRFTLERVEYMPSVLKPGILYASEPFSISAHLCACGCGTKIFLPLKDGEWSLKEGRHGPSLSPSVGNWRIPCRTHYWIADGAVEWSFAWTEDMVEAGRRAEVERREHIYYVPWWRRWLLSAKHFVLRLFRHD